MSDNIIVDVNPRGLVYAANAKVVFFKSEVRQFVSKVSTIALRRFDLTVSKSRVPMTEKKGIQNLISMTNLKTLRSILLSCEQNELIVSCINNCDALIRKAEQARQEFLELNDRGNVAYVDEF